MENSMTQAGSTETDPVIRILKENGIPVTREEYLKVAHMGNPPPWHPELEADLPEHLQDWKLRKWSATPAPAISGVQSAKHMEQQGVGTGYPELTPEEQEEWERTT
jgi:hypothetical protein